MEVNTGDVLLTPGGEVRVLSVDYAADQVHTDGGTFGCEEVEALPLPNTRDPEALEEWLRVKAQVIPRLQVQHQMVRCSCDCSNCYRVDMWEPSTTVGEIRNFRSSHYRNNAQCACQAGECSCRF